VFIFVYICQHSHPFMRCYQDGPVAYLCRPTAWYAGRLVNKTDDRSIYPKHLGLYLYLPVLNRADAVPMRYYSYDAVIHAFRRRKYVYFRPPRLCYLENGVRHEYDESRLLEKFDNSPCLCFSRTIKCGGSEIIFALLISSIS
jgi:hypothetical protein